MFYPGLWLVFAFSYFFTLSGLSFHTLSKSRSCKFWWSPTYQIFLLRILLLVYYLRNVWLSQGYRFFSCFFWKFYKFQDFHLDSPFFLKYLFPGPGSYFENSSCNWAHLGWGRPESLARHIALQEPFGKVWASEASSGVAFKQIWGFSGLRFGIKVKIVSF